MPVTYGGFDREWAEQRAQQQQHYDLISRWVTLAVFALAPGGLESPCCGRPVHHSG